MKRGIDKNVYVGRAIGRGQTLFARRTFKKGGFIFLIAGPVVTEGTRHTIPIGRGLWIDPVPVSNWAKYLNHSCEPNAGIKQRTMVVAFRDIKKNEEIIIDYAMIVYRYGNEMTKKDLVCRCGSVYCREKLGAWSALPPALKRSYRGFVSAAVLERRRK